MKNQPTILVTGAIGMIGFHTIKQLSQDYPDYYFVGIDYYKNDIFNINYSISQQRNLELSKLKNFSLYEHNIIEPFLLETLFNKYNIQHVIHLAAKTNSLEVLNNPQEVLINNQQSFVTVLDAVRLYKTAYSCDLCFKQLHLW